MKNAFATLIRASIGAKSGRTHLNANVDGNVHAPMFTLSLESLKQVRGGDGVIESPKGSWGPVSSETNA